ncbi:MAG TPA: hypothetical protein VGO80_05155 [Solirubrobacteraceae bacterium]|jgi:hypothetical protein|nr:hypothetical protein [Solirubrobacteraceae bacterium]
MPEETYPDDIDEAVPRPGRSRNLIDDLFDFGCDGDPDEPRDHVAVEDIELEKIPRRLWEQTLAPLHRQHRVWIASQVRDPQLKEIASILAFELDMAESARRQERHAARGRAARTGAPLPSPGPRHAVGRTTVQVNIRLRADDHSRLVDAAQAVGLRPTTLARALVLNGVAQVLRDSAT